MALSAWACLLSPAAPGAGTALRGTPRRGSRGLPCGCKAGKRLGRPPRRHWVAGLPQNRHGLRQPSRPRIITMPLVPAPVFGDVTGGITP